jgi:hypothetical protein
LIIDYVGIFRVYFNIIYSMPLMQFLVKSIKSKSK